jgi:hypothetical protein
MFLMILPALKQPLFHRSGSHQSHSGKSENIIDLAALINNFTGSNEPPYSQPPSSIFPDFFWWTD